MPWWASRQRSAACLIAWAAGAEQPPRRPRDTRRPVNARTGTPYRGGNALYLRATATAKGYSDPRWATAQQIKELGGQVRSGEPGTHVIFFQDAQDRKPSRPPRVKCYALFHVQHADGVTLDPPVHPIDTPRQEPIPNPPGAEAVPWERW